ncbi:hypothetical protein ONS95_014750 [Cadophora gregata]|uniref:uncharacterized protein n=1 Tax=Cadophora gregata TaxID=51156 RepID=UPI0026DD6E82|nr:uncharacterized protein ONS95_014750 [Cadophora gregata]KAK0113042.1 hypothetical protein ONS95_014750 [Cadophora gregata]KAK0125162.1 hypothetical protein ONS96_009025 [Cadophora gregata f. sp. sojae]
MANSYKPSPLSYGSPRSSPFRRPESNPTSPSPLRQSTPNPSPTKMATASATTPLRLARNTTPSTDTETETTTWTPRGLAPAQRERESSPTRGATSPGFGGMLTARQTGDINSLSRLQAAQVRELRECFQILDRDSDGQIGREDVADMLTQLGLSANTSDITPFFPSSTSQTVTLPTFLNAIALQLAALSPSAELLSAFSAFDEDDSGQIDLSELRDALLHTAPDPGEKTLTEREIDRVMSGFTGRRAFGKHASGLGKRGEVFKYQEFVSSVAGGANIERKDESENNDE